MTLSLRQLRYFVAAAEMRTISGAAAREHISQSTVALAISELERTLGVQLFLRQQAKGLTITQAGLAVLADARPLLAHADELVSSARHLGGQLSGDLTVGCYTTLAPFLMPGLLQGFAAEHPTVELNFVEGSQVELQERLLDGTCEMALLYELDLQPGVHHETLYRTRPHVLLPHTHPLAGQGAVSLHDLADEPMVLLDYPPSRHYFTQLLASLGVRPTVRHTTSSFETVRSLVARGLGYSLLIQRPPSGISYEGIPLAECAIQEEVPEMPVLLARPTRAKLTRRAQAFADYCRRTLADGPTHPADGDFSIR
ncbi:MULTISPECIES: LysR family transcriptional regulator [unclassified Streptomyces]|uniref:LysR family transcriptional regulator n=1 Tax=Streptomyces sp. NBC_00119 TaxID=2975659 RepID=A0AAU1U3G0_9ACTN|nr:MULTISPECIES: LysR family transcriptional regulator [unclassified Streptomyces]MCX5435603.1 LysR family transcriptional regulator [Streptomyces sp. NBC_00063]WSE08864.1 LysR family transcriptional regulator [Streptomyces sp. NBC_01445]WSE13400.1 LysR family transcriptional regulator [Streptomyces sp. NBC_01397]WUB97683.1 LysR family transcriptional regulator [Streptomyces sp. NBC_00569]